MWQEIIEVDRGCTSALSLSDFSLNLCLDTFFHIAKKHAAILLYKYIIMWSYRFSRSGLNEGKVGKLDVKGTSHWESMNNRQHWIDCDLPVRQSANNYHYCNRRDVLETYCIHQGLVRLQHELVVAADPIDNRPV